MKKNKAGNDKRESDEETANAESTHKKWKQAWKQTTIANKSMVIASVLIAVSTAIYAGVASYQLAALRESNATNREALVSVQRAFLSFSGIDTGVRMLDPITNMITNQQFHLNITNSGTTPALDGVIRASGRSQKDELPKGFDFVDQTLNIQFIVGPKATDGARVTV